MSLPLIATFAIAGQPNEGKTTVLSTLAEIDSALVGPRPGTTTECVHYPVLIDGKEILRFVDTPGFENAPDAALWFRQHEKCGDNLASAFINAHKDQDQFSWECKLLQPIADGAAIIYVVDASRNVHQVDKDEIEIFRLCGNPRVAIINSKDDESQHRKEWELLLGRDFNCVHKFNAHQAKYADRIALLSALKVVIQKWQPDIDQAVKAFMVDWDDRLQETSTALCSYIKEVMTLSLSLPITNADQIDAIKKAVNDKFRRHVVERELLFREQIRVLFKHSKEHWKMPEHSILNDDLFSDEVWKLLGLSKRKLIVTSAIIGGTIGGVIDIHAAGFTVLLGTLGGSAIGGVGAWLSADKAASITAPVFHLKIPGIPFHVPFGGWKLGRSNVQAKANPQSNFLWILIDRALAYVELACSWSHGRREAIIQVKQDLPGRIGSTAQWDRKRRDVLANFVAQYRARSPRPDKQAHAHKDACNVFYDLLKELTETK